MYKVRRASTLEVIHEANLKITKDESETNCLSCFKNNDELVKLRYKVIGKTIHLYCNYCDIYYCINCISKESMNRGKFPRCYHCYYRKRNPKLEVELPSCKYLNCPNNSKKKGYCMIHYNKLYYVRNVRKPTTKRRRSYTRKKFPKPQLLNRNMGNELTIDNDKKDNN